MAKTKNRKKVTLMNRLDRAQLKDCPPLGALLWLGLCISVSFALSGCLDTDLIPGLSDGEVPGELIDRAPPPTAPTRR